MQMFCDEFFSLYTISNTNSRELDSKKRILKKVKKKKIETLLASDLCESLEVE